MRRPSRGRILDVEKAVGLFSDEHGRNVVYDWCPQQREMDTYLIGEYTTTCGRGQES